MKSSMKKLILLSLAFVVVASGCETEGVVGSVWFRPTRMVPNRILFAAHLEADDEHDLGLYVIYSPSTATTRYCYRRGDRDWPAPTVGIGYRSQYGVIYGMGQLKIFDGVLRNTDSVNGPAGDHYAASADTTSNNMRFAYMAGSFENGFNIVIQEDADGTPFMLTTDASSSVSYWTPTWSNDGQWVLYSRVTGTTGADAELWRAHPDGTGVEQLPITTTELPTYATFSPDLTEVFVPGDMTSYNISDGSVGTFDHLRDNTAFVDALDALGYEFVGSPMTGPLHQGDTATTYRQTASISTIWPLSSNDRIWFDMLVADSGGAAPHEVLGIVLLTWTPDTQLMVEHQEPIQIAPFRSEEYRFSIVHPTIIP